jgi:sodium pump decarboxylase gamma subunit
MMELLAKFADPQVMATLPLTDKLLAGLGATVLGMGITLVALLSLQLVITILEKVLNRTKEENGLPVTPAVSPQQQAVPPPLHEDRQLIAVITAAIAMQLRTSPNRIVIKNIEPLPTHGPAWGRAGIIDQMNSRF